MITNFKIPYSDFKSNIRQYINNECQSVWEKQTQNKLKNHILTANAHSLITAEKNKQKSLDVELDTLDLLILVY